jgi:hypothetical protein
MEAQHLKPGMAFKMPDEDTIYEVESIRDLEAAHPLSRLARNKVSITTTSGATFWQRKNDVVEIQPAIAPDPDAMNVEFETVQP